MADLQDCNVKMARNNSENKSQALAALHETQNRISFQLYTITFSYEFRRGQYSRCTYLSLPEEERETWRKINHSQLLQRSDRDLDTGYECYQLELARLVEFDLTLAYLKFFSVWQWLVAVKDIVHGYLFAFTLETLPRPDRRKRILIEQYPYARGIFNWDKDQLELCAGDRDRAPKPAASMANSKYLF